VNLDILRNGYSSVPGMTSNSTTTSEQPNSGYDLLTNGLGLAGLFGSFWPRP
jgi:hypothetical protein